MSLEYSDETDDIFVKNYFVNFVSFLESIGSENNTSCRSIVSKRAGSYNFLHII